VYRQRGSRRSAGFGDSVLVDLARGGEIIELELVRLLPADGVNESCIVMQDIEGNEFDLG
jgi:hypothetical protein